MEGRGRQAHPELQMASVACFINIRMRGLSLLYILGLVHLSTCQVIGGESAVAEVPANRLMLSLIFASAYTHENKRQK